MKCKFCGCTDKRACAIPMLWSTTPDVEELLMFFGDTRYPVIARAGQVAEFTTPCHWSAPHICSAPACVERAYQEICEAIDLLMAQELAA